METFLNCLFFNVLKGTPIQQCGSPNQWSYKWSATCHPINYQLHSRTCSDIIHININIRLHIDIDLNQAINNSDKVCTFKWFLDHTKYAHLSTTLETQKLAPFSSTEERDWGDSIAKILRGSRLSISYLQSREPYPSPVCFKFSPVVLVSKVMTVIH